jgi:hypothetical protein
MRSFYAKNKVTEAGHFRYFVMKEKKNEKSDPALHSQYTYRQIFADI